MDPLAHKLLRSEAIEISTRLLENIEGIDDRFIDGEWVDTTAVNNMVVASTFTSVTPICQMMNNTSRDELAQYFVNVSPRNMKILLDYIAELERQNALLQPETKPSIFPLVGTTGPCFIPPA